MKAKQWIEILEVIKKHFPKSDIRFECLDFDEEVWLIIETDLKALEAHKKLKKVDKFIIENNFDINISLE